MTLWGRIGLFCLFGFLAQTSWAFPQMIRHGYTSCTSCHASPRGGGLMTPYGRAISKEVLSTWSYEGEQNWHYGALDQKKRTQWLNLGGDFRGLQAHSNDERATIGRYITMQEQVEVAAQVKNFLVGFSAGSDTLQESRPWYLPGFYVLAQLRQKLSAKIGRFIPRFGVNTPEHIFSTRGPLDFGIQAERDTLELTYTEAKWDLSLAAVTGQLRSERDAHGVYSQFNYSFTNKDRIGFSFEKKFKDNEALSLGLHGLIGFSEKLYLISDTVWRQSQTSTGSEKQEGFFHFAKLGYELEKGLHIILIEDLAKEDLDLSNSTQFLYGAGLTFFPRPHIELQGVFAQRVQRARSDQAADYAWFLMHYYL